MPDSLPRLTTIVAVYNSEKTLQRCFDSFARQDYPHKELIVIDGASTDRSLDIIVANERHIHYWESSRDKGVYDAWNKALPHITGDWIHFLGSDDYLSADDVFSRASGWLSACDPDTRVAYGRVQVVSQEGERLETRGAPWNEAGQQFMKEMSILHSGVFHRRSLFEIHGSFDDTFRIAGDYEFLLRELKTGAALFIPDLVVTVSTVGGLSSSPGMTLIARKEDARARKLHGLAPRPMCWWNGYFKAHVYRILGLVLGREAATSCRNYYRRVKG